MTPEQAAHAAADRDMAAIADVKDEPLPRRDLYVRAFLAGRQQMLEELCAEMREPCNNGTRWWPMHIADWIEERTKKMLRDGELPSNALDRRTASPVREDPKA